ncbi:MAG: ABC transporter substrate-binding protein, partial [Bradyrhizobium sp.]|nr:ABC transporter substrate-binding protein [Bradyrhizobium sp.]
KAVYASNDMMAAGARLAAKGAGKLDQVKILGTDGLPGPAGGIRAVAEGEWAATFTYPTGGPEAIEMAKSILLDCAEKVPAVVTVPTTAITPENAKQLMRN